MNKPYLLKTAKIKEELGKNPHKESGDKFEAWQRNYMTYKNDRRDLIEKHFLS